MQKIFILLILSASILGCSLNRKPAGDSAQGTFTIQTDLLAETARLRSYLEEGRLTAENCAPFLTELYQQMYRITPHHFQQQSIKAENQKIVENIFASKIALRKQVKIWNENSQLSPACRDAVRTAFRTGRVLEDYLLAIRLNNPKLNKEKTDRTLALEGGADYFMLSPEFSSYEPKSGDIFLSRGTAVTSAAIARITETDSNFSHLAILYVDEESQKPFMVEAHIEVGSKIATLKEYQADGKARAAVFRYADSQLAHKAAKLIYEKVKARELAKDNIPYDFAMDLKETNTLFCSEVVAYAYRLASQGTLEMPLIPSGMTMKNDQFLKRIGVTVATTFAPADIELDTRFEFIGEWRDIKQIDSLHMMDMVLTQIFHWMNSNDYKFHNSPLTAIGKYALWTGRRLPLFSNLLKEKFPKNMKPQALGMMATLQDVGSELYEALEKENDKIFAQTGYRMTPKQMVDFLEEFRKLDLTNYKDNGGGKIHRNFRNKADTYYPPASHN